MTTDANERILKARQQLENAIQEIVRISRDDDDSIFIQDWALVVNSESMAPGCEHLSFVNTINRLGMASYQVIGLHQVGAHYYLNSGEHG